MNGNNIIVYMQNGSSWTAIAATKTDNIEVDGELIEIASDSQTDQQWKKHTAGRKSWSITVGFLVTAVGDLRKVLTANTRVKLRIGARTFSSSSGLEGYAWVKTVSLSAPRGSLSQGNIKFVGDGALT